MIPKKDKDSYIAALLLICLKPELWASFQDYVMRTFRDLFHRD